MRFINIKHGNRVKKLNWRHDLKEESLRLLLQSLFEIEQPDKMVGLVNQKKELVSLEEVVRNIDRYSKEILVIKTAQSDSQKKPDSLAKRVQSVAVLEQEVQGDSPAAVFLFFIYA